jgi:hypothetical protein
MALNPPGALARSHLPSPSLNTAVVGGSGRGTPANIDDMFAYTASVSAAQPVAPPSGDEAQPAAQPAAPPPPPKLLLDSGASFHVVGDPSLLSNLHDAPAGMTVTVANGNSLPITKIGDITAGFTIPDVHLAPGIKMDLISVRVLTRSRICTWFDGDRATLYAGPNLVGVAVAPQEKNGLYVLESLSVPKIAAASSANCLDGEMKLVWCSSSARAPRPIQDKAPAATMSFPPRFALSNSMQTYFHDYLLNSKCVPTEHSQSMEPTPKKKQKCVDSSSGASKR